MRIRKKMDKREVTIKQNIEEYIRAYLLARQVC